MASRTPIGWHPKELEQGGPIFGALFSRLLVHCFDWASHLPELMCLDDEDKVNCSEKSTGTMKLRQLQRLLLKRRTMRSMWWLVSRRSVPFQKGPQGMLVGGEMFYPREPALQAKLDPALRGLLTDAVNMAYDQLILPMREHGVSEAESALLRAIAFFTPGGSKPFWFLYYYSLLCSGPTQCGRPSASAVRTKQVPGRTDPIGDAKALFGRYSR